MLCNVSSNISDSDLEVYIGHLKQLREEMLVRFRDLIEMEIPDWIVNPFTFPVENIDISLQESLIDLQSDHEARARFRQGFNSLWLSIEMPSKVSITMGKSKTLTNGIPNFISS